MSAAGGVHAGQLVQWLLEYGSRVKDIQERAYVYSHASYVAKGLPLLHSVLQQHPQLLNGGSGGDAKAQKEFLRALPERAATYIGEVQPLVFSLKVISQNLASTGQLLTELHRVLGSLTLRSYHDLLHKYMEAFCDAVKAALLLEDVPRRAAAQLVHLACPHVDKAVGGPLLAAVEDPIFASGPMLVYLQRLFAPFMPRIAQVLELVVGPALSVADDCEGVAAAGLLDVTPVWHTGTAAGGVAVAPGGAVGAAEEEQSFAAMGMQGMTRRQVLAFLRNRETIRQWGVYGFLVFPGMLRQAGAPERLSSLLIDGFMLHVYKDRFVNVHLLAMQHLGPAAAAALGSGAPGSCAGTGATSGGGLGALIGKGFNKLRRSMTDDMEAAERPQGVHPLLAGASAAASLSAPLQHSLWRLFLTGQLRNMHAVCSALPARIPELLETLLAAMSLGREEVLWYCRHAQSEMPAELASILAARGMAVGSPLVQGSQEDALQALQLMSALDALHRLLIEHHCALSKQIRDARGAELQTHVVPCTPRVEFRLRQAAAQAAGGNAAAAAAAASSNPGVQPFKDLTDLLRSVLLSSSVPSDAAGRVASARGVWLYLNLQMAFADPPLKAARVLQYAEDTAYLDTLQQSLDAARLLYEGPLLHSAAADLAPGLQPCVEPLLAAVQAALGSGQLERVQAALGAMQGLHWLLPARDEAYAAAAAAAAAVSSGGASGVQPRRSTLGDSSGSSSSGGASSARGSSQSSEAPLPRRSKLQPGAGDDLPQRCSGLVLSCVAAQLDPLVQAPLATASALCSSMQPLSLDKAASGGGSSSSGPWARSTLGKAMTFRLRASSDTALGKAVACGGGADEGAALADLPSAQDLAARIMPLALALDQGRMLLADMPDAGGQRSGGAAAAVTAAPRAHTRGQPPPVGPAGEAVDVCRSQLVEVVRDGFAQLLANTALAIAQVPTPVPSVQLAPLQRYVEIVSALQPHLATELLPELVRLLLAQAGASTLQSAGVGALPPSAGGQYGPAMPPPSTAEAAMSTMHKAPLMSAARTPSATSGPSAGGAAAALAGRSFTQLPPPAGNSSGGLQDRGVGPLAAGLSSGGASMQPPSSYGGGAASASAAAGGGGWGAASVLRALHAWLWSAVVHDSSRAGVWYDSDAGAFTAATADADDGDRYGRDLAAATSVRELALVFELFGPCAAADMTRGVDHVMLACLEQLQAALAMHAAPLQQLLDAARLPLDQRLQAAQRALATIAPAALSSATSAAGAASGLSAATLATLADAATRLGRCLALRMQLGRAAAAAAARAAEFVTLALQEVAAPLGVGRGGGGGGAVAAAERRTWGGLVRLAPSNACGYDGGLPDREDPLLTGLLAGFAPSLPAAQLWHRWPALLALLLAAPQCTAAGGSGSEAPSASSTPAPSRASGKGGSITRGGGGGVAPQPGGCGVHSLAMAAVGLALSVPGAMAQVLHPAASQFLLGCAAPPAAMLCAFQRSAVAVLQAAASAAVASGGGAAAAAAEATAVRQAMLGRLEEHPLLRDYAFTPFEAATSSSSGGGGDAAPASPTSSAPASDAGDFAFAAPYDAAKFGVRGKQSAGSLMLEVEADAEPPVEDSRWSGGVDAWRPAARLLPMALGHRC